LKDRGLDAEKLLSNANEDDGSKEGKGRGILEFL